MPGVILSPNHPANYTNNTVCAWVIRADADAHVVMSINDFDTEANFDFLYVSIAKAAFHAFDELNIFP